MTKILLVSSPKGGSGKSVLARHLMVSAAQDGISVLGVDYDRQSTFCKWGERRKATRVKFPEFVDAEVVHGDLKNWRSSIADGKEKSLLIVDTPPSVEDHLAAITQLSSQSDMILVPAVCTQDDMDSVAPWIQVMIEHNKNAVIVLNRANRRTTSFARVRGRLIKLAEVCPVEIPQLEDVHVPSSKGLTLLDYTKSKGQASFEEIWAFVRRRLGL
ncbi:ParA family protein [Beijerinckia indica]|uniref:CobQ/CobB/MinD/ParA nucleotide binding domain-containing protein n=1 Tax=Beijerinckia indica subsp. indica (strain ATCC 9039 / DSM 1715 / NCIMB 8712) TaxID=395963 RepID=B2ILA4_BEII9|nr:ParA family protein [Beijerinckia indica]ACB97304.1 hypothetical protein Bind_3754 [Beijerinckia indica subsp. indica ATCC 9039]